ncbi:MAG TPA: DNA double-strand break repair nuclease NurA [Dehalococcoidia bacterium]|nr:DNA double-strand break repair nuclease NurA [Dehalococcoidia bacterium]
MPLTLRLDPWAPSYESALQVEEDETDAARIADVNTFVETDDWRPIAAPAPDPWPQPIFFIDGVRRVDTGVIEEADGGIVYGLLGSYAAGVTIHRDGKAAIHAENIGRRVVLGAGRETDPILVPAGSLTLEYRFAGIADNSRHKVMTEIQVLMRKLEGDLGRVIAEQGDCLTFVDGPLTYLLPLEEPILGYVKTHSRYYVGPEHMPVLGALEPGTRTPVFQFGTEGASRYSWYTRVGPRRALDHSMAGVIRVEVSATVGAETAVGLADTSTAILPRFATTSAWDPRAPQNLYPVSALESRLHQRLGDREFVRRSIAVHFQRLLSEGIAA